MVVDLSDFGTIRPGVEGFLRKEERLDGLIHNAAVMSVPLGSKDKQVRTTKRLNVRKADNTSNREMISNSAPIAWVLTS